MIHILIAVIDESLNKVWKWLIDITKMHFKYLSTFTKIFDRFNNIFAHQVSTLKPATDTETHADIWTVSDFKGAFISLETAENTSWNSCQVYCRRVIWMDTYHYTSFFCYRSSLLDKIGIVIPYFLFTILTFV